MSKKEKIEVNKDLVFDWMLDLRKKGVDKCARAKIVKEYIENEGISVRALSIQLGINNSVVQDWLLYDRLSEEEYQELIDSGYTQTDIYRHIRDNKKKSIAKIFDRSYLLDNKLRTAIFILKPLVKKQQQITKSTYPLILELENIAIQLKSKADPVKQYDK